MCLIQLEHGRPGALSLETPPLYFLGPRKAGDAHLSADTRGPAIIEVSYLERERKTTGTLPAWLGPGQADNQEMEEDEWQSTPL